MLHGVRSVAAGHIANAMASAHYSYRPPNQLKVSGSDVADNWHRFKDQWYNYELCEALSEKSAAVFMCVSPEACDAYRAMHFESDEDLKKINRMLSLVLRHSASV